MFFNRLYFKPVQKELVSNFIKKFNDEYESKEIGYYDLPDNMQSIITQSIELKNEYKNLKDVVVLGTGGSSLGAKAISSMLINEGDIAMHFMENLDATTINKTLKHIDKNSSLFFIVSKSGTTLETLTLLKIAMKKLNIKKSEYSKSFVIITDKNSPLEEFGKKHKIRVFNIPSNVGGRFSVFSACGLVPLTLCGYDTKSLLLGAKECKKDYMYSDNNSIVQKAYKYVMDKNATINVLFSYGDAFREFNAWYIQLWAESLGKKSNNQRVGLTPVGLIGSVDQHSFLQLIMQGVKDKSVTFIKQKRDINDVKISQIDLEFLPNADLSSNFSVHEILNMQCDATLQSVVNEGITTDIIELDCLDSWHIGYLMYYYELLTSMCGIMLDVNTYNQPGVEVGKEILKNMLKTKGN